jgi:hypothetical protein
MRLTGPRARIACFLLVQGLSGCGAAPTAPTPSQPVSLAAPIPAPIPPPTVSVLVDATLSGRVYEVIADSPRRIVGIEGVSVYCEPCGESTHNFATTDTNGEYVFPKGIWTEGQPMRPTRILVQKDGYQDPPGLPKTTPPNPSGPGWREVLINGDTRFEIELIRR